ncbi:MAG TPA: hypothetical protein VFB44_11850 [Thermoleophilaceae bacterium]|nr:hypothetical protein [Thermoleophilaceae bacterium]
MRSRLLCLVLAGLVVAAPAALALAAPVANPAERLVDLPIDDEAYDHATDCRKRPSAGALALVDWLEANAAGESWGIMRCERWGKGRASLHAEGRAVDWHLDARLAADRREARRLIDLFLATDSAGNERALARRMGIQELIWNCRSWWSGSDGTEPYSGCFTEPGARRRGVSPTAAHRDHIHIGLSRAGARKRTSFWAR